MPLTNAARLERLSAELGAPGVQPLWLAVRRSGLNVTKAAVSAFVKTKGEKQVLTAIQPSRGKTVGETLDARWQIDLAFLPPADGYTAFLVCVNVFDRFTWSKALKTKQPKDVAAALEYLLDSAQKKPKLISSDNGPEFHGPTAALLVKKKIAQAYKAVGDTNALGVIDRTVQTLKGKLAELGARTNRSWPSMLLQATLALNDTPKPGVLHGDAPAQIRDDVYVQFMLQQDAARNLQHNKRLTEKRTGDLQNTGAFRAPLPGTTSKFKRGFQATYGNVQQAVSINGSTVTDAGGAQHNIKQIKIVPAGSTAANADLGNQVAGPQRRKRLGAPIMDALEQILQGEERMSITQASTKTKALMLADGQDYTAILRSTRGHLIDLIRLDDERFELVERDHGARQTWYFVALK